MWQYEKTLQYPVNIANPDPALARVIISQLGGPDGEVGAATRYLSQRYAAPCREVQGILTDIGISVSKLHTLFGCGEKTAWLMQIYRIILWFAVEMV